MAFLYKSVLLCALAAIAFANGQCACQNVGQAPTCSGVASGVLFTITCTIPSQGDNNIFFAAQGLTDTEANPAWQSTPTVQFMRTRVPNAGGFVSVNCTNTNTPRFYAPSGQDWTYSYDESSCEVIATLEFGPNNLPTSFLFDNESSAVSVTAIPNYNVITVPIGIGVSTQISDTQVTVTNTLFTFYATLPQALTADTTRYALKLFKLSDNNRGLDLAFSAIVMGGLTTGTNANYLVSPVFIPDPSSPSLTCTVQSEIYVTCGPFIDTNAPSPVTVSGILEVYATCQDADCIERLLTLPVSFLAGDYKSTLNGTWSTLDPLIWRRPDNNDTEAVDLTNDVIVAGDKLILSLDFDAGSVSTLTKLFITVNGYSGAGSTLVEYSTGNANNVFVIYDPSNNITSLSTIIYNQLQQAALDSFFQFPSGYSENFGVEWSWPAALPLDYRGSVEITAYFNIAVGSRRREDTSGAQVVLIQGPSAAVGTANSDGSLIILEGSSTIVHCVASLALAVLLLVLL